MQLIFLFFTLFLSISYTFSNSLEYQRYITDECENNKLVLTNRFSKIDVDCNELFHHYQFENDGLEVKSQVKIAGYNIYKLGDGQTKFKDYLINAEMLNQWDIIGTSEIIRLVSDGLSTNNSLKKLLQQNKITDNTYLKAYRLPGYVSLLLYLNKVNPSAGWSLLLTPYSQSKTNELVGYYYKSSIVQPKENQYCLDQKIEIEEISNLYIESDAYACLPIFSDDIENSISRKPFIATFESGNFDFTLLAAHLRFREPNDDILDFQKNYVLDISKKENKGFGYLDDKRYARFAEVKIILDLMDDLKRSSDEKDLILVGDLNLEIKKLKLKKFGKFNPWDAMLDPFSTLEIFVSEPTSVTEKYGKGGLKSNYDHFIFDYRDTTECISGGESDAQAFNFLDTEYYKKQRWAKIYNTFYLVNDNYELEKKYNKFEKLYTRYAKHIFYVEKSQVTTLYNYKNGSVFDKNLKDLKRRVFESQLYDKTYYKTHKEVISDHIPIFMTCDTDLNDDD